MNKSSAFSSEQEFYDFLDRLFPNTHSSLSLGRGDDCAVIQCPHALCISTDLFLEDIHFRREYFSPADIGYKALAVNISDVAAMGAKPLGFSMGLMAPSDLDSDFYEAMLSSMAELAAAHGIMLTGGDISRSHRLGISITIWGDAPSSGSFLLREKGTPGDMIFYAGSLGLARAGLLSLEQSPDIALQTCPEAVKSLLRPPVLLREARTLSSSGCVTSMMDVSDGLAADLPRLLGPETGAEITLSKEMLHPEILWFCTEHNLDPVEVACRGGDDYGLLGCVPADKTSQLTRLLPESLILGKVTSGPSITCNGREVSHMGYDHFST